LFAGGSVEHHNGPRLRDVDEYPVGLAVELEPFWVGRHGECGDLAFLDGIDRGDAAAAKSDQHAICVRIDAYVVGIIAQFDAAGLLEVAALVHAD
jgi:hypothetical protein